MGKGHIHVIPEVAEQAELWLPRGINVVSRRPYGGAVALEIDGDEVEEGIGYQLVVTEAPTWRKVELIKNPYPSSQDDFIPRRLDELEEENAQLRAEIAPFDGDQDGHIGGARKKKPKAVKKSG